MQLELQHSRDTEWIVSVGIDIGTSTTKMIVSRLRLQRTSGAHSLPRYDIVERELLYASPIHTTPLRSGDEVDAERIWQLLTKEYELAGIQSADLKSGAVIITGETANKRNARHIVHMLAERAGDFVVATAGAELEGLLAGKGAGAELRSSVVRGTVVNIDVGGGTANAAFFHRGKPAGTVTFHVGGRLLQVDESGKLLAIAPSIQPWLRSAGCPLHPGQSVSLEQLHDICTRMCRTMLDYIAELGLRPGGVYKPAFREAALPLLLLGDPPTLTLPPIEEWMFSGGIGELMDDAGAPSLEEGWAGLAVHQDIGPLLAYTLKNCLADYPIRHIRADQTIRATVIGAGMQSTEISGATVFLHDASFPIRNLPVVKLKLAPEQMKHPSVVKEMIVDLLLSCAKLYEREPGDDSPPFAVAITGIRHWSYTMLQQLSEALAEAYLSYFPGVTTLVIVCEGDMAKALGQSLAIRCGKTLSLICIDQIQVEHGDYIDLGEPISGIMLPVVVKTLAFQSNVKEVRT